MNILVTGANGQLGNEIRVTSKNTSYNYFFTDVVSPGGCETTVLDITDINAIRETVKSNKIECIINCAAYTNVDKAESDEESCRILNATAPQNLAIVMKEVNGLLIHISTDYVFGGYIFNTPCSENQKGIPLGIYGQTKLAGEQYIIDSDCKYVIIRTSWLYSEFGKNFVKTMLNLTATKPKLNVVFDQVGTPTYAFDLAIAINAVIDDYINDKANIKYNKKGIYHFSNEGVCSWYDFTKAIAEIARNTECDIQPCHSNEYPSSVIRPAYSVLDKTKIKNTFELNIPYWIDSLRVCINNLMNQ